MVTLLLVAGDVSAGLTADYQLLGNLESSVAGAPALTPIGANTTFIPGTVDGHTQPVLAFAQGNGLSLAPTTSVLPDSGTYTIVALVQFATIAGFRKYFDFKNASVDTGLYDSSGNLRFYNYTAGSGTPIATGYVDIALTRTAAGTLAGYVDGMLQFTADDSANQYGVIDVVNTLRFFVDDNATSGIEASDGAVARIRVWDSALIADEIKTLEQERVDQIFGDSFDIDVCAVGCPPAGWQYRLVSWGPSSIASCVTDNIYGLVPGDAFLFTTCAPTSGNSGDTILTSLIDNTGFDYMANNDDCTNSWQIPQLVGWTCNNTAGKLRMSCAPANGAGVIGGPSLYRMSVTICPVNNEPTTAPLYIWWNGTSNPNPG